jgi:4-hydroxy-tetrahydrodipicolinate synthase
MFKGMIVALVTPFTEQQEVDYKALEKLVERLVEAKVDGIVCYGTTGEAPTLTEEEKREILTRTVCIAKGKVPILAGTGSYNTKESLRQTIEAKELGADGALIVVPYYNRPTPQGCIAHFQELAKADFPMIVYPHPARTGIHLSAKTLAEICEIPQVVAVKEGPGNVELVLDLCRLTSKPVLSGDDEMTIPVMSVGGAGIISVIGNLIPKEWKRCVDTYASGDPKKALEICRTYLSLCKSLFLETNPQGIKYALSLMGFCLPHLRLPMIEPQEATKKQIAQQMEEAGLINYSFAC